MGGITPASISFSEVSTAIASTSAILPDVYTIDTLPDPTLN
jgi:hypothetical protein